MGRIFYGYGYNRRGKSRSWTEDRFERAWRQLSTPIRLIREYKQDVRLASSIYEYRYIDFAYSKGYKVKLAIEIDGPEHNKADDAERTKELERLGWEVYRFTNNQVWQDPEGCAIEVQKHIQRLTQQYTNPWAA